jgi:signal transduction histidine kinase
MVVRTQRGTPRELDPILDEAAGHLAPILERKAVSDRVAAREQTLLTSAARRLVDLGFDLHDGPMQSLVALGYEVDRARRRADAALPADAGRDVVDRLDRMLEILGHLEGELRSVVADLTPLAIFKDARSASAAVGVSNGAPSDREVDHASAHR